MSDFKVPIVKVDAIEPIEGADRIVAAVVGGYQCVVMKDQFRPGDLAAYIPEGSIVPDDILADMGLTGKLSGSRKNRVKAIKLKNCLSQGLLYPYNDVVYRAAAHGFFDGLCRDACSEKQNEFLYEECDVAALLGITKYEPPCPASSAGNWRGLAATTNC